MKQKIIKEQKADASSVSQPIAKPYVARSFSENFDKKKFDKQWFWNDFPNGHYFWFLFILSFSCTCLFISLIVDTEYSRDIKVISNANKGTTHFVLS